MKKVIMLALILISFIPFIIKKSDYKDITNVVYVSSIGLDYNIETKEYQVYFYILNNFNLSNAQLSSGNTDELSYVVKISDASLINAFSSILKKTNIGIYYTHLQTMIISHDFFNATSITEFFHYIKELNQIYFNFFIFTTDSKIEDLYNIKIFSDVSAYHTILVTPSLIKNYKLVTFQNFANAFLNSSYTLLIPHITIIEDTFFDQDQDYFYLEMDGYSILQKDLTIKTFLINEFTSLRWLINLQDQSFKIGNYDLYIKNGNYKIKKRNDLLIITFNLSSVLNYNPHYEKLDVIEEKLNQIIASEIQTLYEEMKKQEIDIFNLNYRIGPATLDHAKIEIKVHTAVH